MVFLLVLSLDINQNSLRYTLNFKVIFPNVCRANFKWGARKSINFSKKWWVLIDIIRVVHRWTTIVIFFLRISLDIKRGLSWTFAYYKRYYIIEITIVGGLIYFSLRYEYYFKINIHNMYRKNFKGEGARKTINIITIQWVLIIIISVVHRFSIIMFFFYDCIW